MKDEFYHRKNKSMKLAQEQRKKKATENYNDMRKRWSIDYIKKILSLIRNPENLEEVVCTLLFLRRLNTKVNIVCFILRSSYRFCRRALQSLHYVFQRKLMSARNTTLRLKANDSFDVNEFIVLFSPVYTYSPGSNSYHVDVESKNNLLHLLGSIGSFLFFQNRRRRNRVYVPGTIKLQSEFVGHLSLPA